MSRPHPSFLTKLTHLAAFTSRTYLHENYSWWPTLEWNAITGLSAAAAADILIAVSLVYLLHTRCSDVKETRTLVNRLILYTIETGALTSICAMAIVILFVSMPNNLIDFGLEFVLPKRKIFRRSNRPYLDTESIFILLVYANSFMAILNSRASMREGPDEILELPSGGALQIRTTSTVWRDPPISVSTSGSLFRLPALILVLEYPIISDGWV